MPPSKPLPAGTRMRLQKRARDLKQADEALAWARLALDRDIEACYAAGHELTAIAAAAECSRETAYKAVERYRKWLAEIGAHEAAKLRKPRR